MKGLKVLLLVLVMCYMVSMVVSCAEKTEDGGGTETEGNGEKKAPEGDGEKKAPEGDGEKAPEGDGTGG